MCIRDSSKALARVKTEAEAAMRKDGLDPVRGDWREHIYFALFSDPYKAPPPPSDWAKPEFDDQNWVLDRGTFQGDLPDNPRQLGPDANMAKVHIDSLQYLGVGLRQAYYRTRFMVKDRNQAGEFRLQAIYRGGIRIVLNGVEVARGHLPVGELTSDTPGEDYPAAAYEAGGEHLRNRSLSVAIPATAIREGINVLAVEIRASRLHPKTVAKPRSGSWNTLHEREGLWRHGHLSRFSLMATGKVESALERPKGGQVWVADMHSRVRSTDFLPPGESAGTVRVVGAQNGIYSAQIVVGSDVALSGLTIEVADLKREGGNETIPSQLIRVARMFPFPENEFSHNLGDERGLAATFPDQPRLEAMEAESDLGKVCIFDHIGSVPPAHVPAGMAQPVWLSFRFPPDAVPGVYRGVLKVTADPALSFKMPVEAVVIGWRLPVPRDFRVFAGCEENPYGVAKQYQVEPWSPAHLKLLEGSFRELSRIGGAWINLPVLRRTEYGNKEDSIIQWIKKPDGSLRFDYSHLDTLLDTVLRYGQPRLINFVVMHGMLPKLNPTIPEVNVKDEATGKTMPMAVGGGGLSQEDKRRLWHAFARSLYDHMRARGLEKRMYWGYPQDREEDPELMPILAECAPDVFWTAAPHQMCNWVPNGNPWAYKDPRYFKVVGSVRFFREVPDFAPQAQHWRSPSIHLAIPRIDSTILSLHTVSYPFAYRTLVDRAIGLGRQGVGRMGADEWGAIHYDGMVIPQWIVGMPVLFTLWPGRTGAESSARLEAMIEGIQTAEARLFLQEALKNERLSPAMAAKIRNVLTDTLQEISFFQVKLCVHELEKYHYRWQERSRLLYQTAAEVATQLRNP
ncbi:MAG: hypothetical protein N2255_03215 [Kiritimatiellae bacterium]|nr:hypothetical protein [Kiritimatiellia bacterium]